MYLRIFGLIGESRQQHEPLALDLRGYIVHLGGHCRLRLIKKQTPTIIFLQTQDLSYLKKKQIFLCLVFFLITQILSLQLGDDIQSKSPTGFK